MAVRGQFDGEAPPAHTVMTAYGYCRAGTLSGRDWPLLFRTA